MMVYIVRFQPTRANLESADRLPSSFVVASSRSQNTDPWPHRSRSRIAAKFFPISRNAVFRMCRMSLAFCWPNHRLRQHLFVVRKIKCVRPLIQRNPRPVLSPLLSRLSPRTIAIRVSARLKPSVVLQPSPANGVHVVPTFSSLTDAVLLTVRRRNKRRPPGKCRCT